MYGVLYFSNVIIQKRNNKFLTNVLLHSGPVLGCLWQTLNFSKIEFVI